MDSTQTITKESRQGDYLGNKKIKVKSIDNHTMGTFLHTFPQLYYVILIVTVQPKSNLFSIITLPRWIHLSLILV